MNTTILTKNEHLNSVHRLSNSIWSQEIKALRLGKCVNIYFHEHNYNLELKLNGEILESTGCVTDTSYLSVYLRGLKDDSSITIKSFFDGVFNNSKKIVELQNYLKL